MELYELPADVGQSYFSHVLYQNTVDLFPHFLLVQYFLSPSFHPQSQFYFKQPLPVRCFWVKQLLKEKLRPFEWRLNIHLNIINHQQSQSHHHPHPYPIQYNSSDKSLIYNYIISVMYSKYLDYSQPANKAHLAAQNECEQKDVVIGQLKNEIFQLKQLDGDFHRLNQLISSLQGKYTLLLAEKERSQKDQKLKFDIDKKTTIELRGEIDDLRVQLQKSNLVIEELLRENSNIKRQCDGRSAEIQSIRFQIKEAENKNQRSNDENKQLSLSVKGLKEERKRLEDECEQLSAELDSQIAKLKSIEKDVRSIESGNARLEKTLYQAERDNSKLEAELKEKSDDIKRAEGRLKGVNNSIAELGITCKNLEQQAGKSKGELDRNTAVLENQINKGREIQGRISAVQGTIRSQENDLDVIIAEQEKLRKEHFAALQKNKGLNGQIDRVLALIAEYELVNRQLLDEIEIFIEQDEQARCMLDRKQFMREVIESSIRKIALTEEPIKHLKC